ncbi:hypothetical protein tb265_18050 [Gemmatimonadetes bacterium T265]|nr:hypothetical protein tb265_18050 [Gemmatimonadetes bacterium T265]
MTYPAAPAGPWLARWRAWHARAAGLTLSAIVVTALVAPAGVRPGTAVQVAALAAAVAVFGVPHGALDPLVGRRWLSPRFGVGWWAPFHGAYVVLGAAVVVGWTFVPAATLTAFLAASALHFGLGDGARERAPRRLAWAEVLVRGAAPVVVPALAHPDAVAQAFAWVAPNASPGGRAAIVTASAWCARWVVVPGCAFFALAHTAGAWRAARRATSRQPRPRPRAARRLATVHLTDALECLAVPAVAALLPPFLAFLVYFCVLHSARHALALAAALDAASPRRAWARFTRAAVPATAATLALGAAAWLALSRGADAAAGAAPAAVRVLFAGLAALTAPHTLLTALAGEGLGGAPPARHADAAPAARSARLAPRPVQLVPQRADRDA